jgi:sucrose-phosphate synthase
LHIVSIALGGCLRSEPVSYGITEDTGGHITYILGEMRALARHPRVSQAEIVTRLFNEPHLGEVHVRAREEIAPGLAITRIDSGNRRYLAKEELRADRAAFVAALIAELRSRERLPDLIHAHFADAADVAAQVQRALGIPYIYTAHSLGLDKRETLEAPCAALEARISEEARAIGGAAAVIGSSRDECERQLVAYPTAEPAKIHRVVPGISLEPATAESLSGARNLIAPFLRDPSLPIVLAIARPVHKKNLDTLVQAFAGIEQPANLVILAGQRQASDAGEPEQVEVITQLLHLIDRHDLYGRVAYPKSHSSADVAGLYALAAKSRGVFVNPALIEPYGLTILEAAAHGLPVIATNVGGPLDTVSEIEHGLLIDPRNRSEIGGAIERLLSDRELWSRCAANGPRGAADLNWDRYAQGFVAIARDLSGTENARAARVGPGVTSLFVSDLDNTLTGCANGVERLRGFLEAHPDFAFVIATGRSVIEARRIVREWGIPEPAAWIASVGSEIYWSGSAGPVRDRAFPNLGQARWDAAAVEAVMAELPQLRPQPIYEQRDFKRSYFYADAADVEQVRVAMRKACLPVRLIASHGSLLDILPLGAGKAAAMNHVGAALGIEPGHIYAAGDSGNDEDMLTACENAIIVQNHSAEIARLTQRPNVYLATKAHGLGAVEGIEAHGERQTVARRTARSGARP